MAGLVVVFREVRRVLKNDGTLWLNLGDSYSSNTKGTGGNGTKSGLRKDGRNEDSRIKSACITLGHQKTREPVRVSPGLQPKQLVGIPWRVAFALQADGWYLRSDIIWHKPNAMPESVRDRPTKAHEYLFLLSKSDKYFYDVDAVREPHKDLSRTAKAAPRGSTTWAREAPIGQPQQGSGPDGLGQHPNGRNRRSVWSINTKPFKGAHFAVFPPDLITPCILAGSRPGDTILDPFAGAGTTLLVSEQFGRDSIGIELNPEYCQITRSRLETAASIV